MTMLGWLVFQLTDSALLVTLVGFFGMGPMLILGTVGGLLADKTDKRKLLVITASANLIASTFMTALLYFGDVNSDPHIRRVGARGANWMRQHVRGLRRAVGDRGQCDLHQLELSPGHEARSAKMS